MSPAAAYVVNAIVDPDRVAVIGDDRAVTYAQLDRRTNSLARALAEAGAGPERKLAILCRNGPAFVESVVTAAKLGADPLPLNTSFSAAEVAAVLEREQPPVIVFEDELAGLLDQVPAGAPIARIVAGPENDSAVGRSYERLATTGPADPPEPPADEGRMVILTSGTTGTPKGARLGRPGGLDPLAWFLRVVPLNAGSVVMVPAPLFHAHGYGQLVVAAAMGSTIVLPSRFDPERTLELIERHRVNSMAVVPVMLKRIMDLPAETRRRYDTSSLRAVVASGSALEPELARAFMDAFGPVLYNLYGSTEMAFATIATPVDMLEAPGTVGKPVPNTRVVLLDEQGRPVPTGEIGRIFVGSELMFDGYTDDSASRDMAEGMMTVGDLGHMDSRGPPVRRCARGRHDRLRRGERVPGRGRGGAAPARRRQRGGRGRRRRRALRPAAGRLRRPGVRQRSVDRPARRVRAREPGALQGAARVPAARRAPAQRDRQGAETEAEGSRPPASRLRPW